jgi:Cytochrome P450
MNDRYALLGSVFLLAFVPLALVAYVVSIRFRRGLRGIPGPFWASISPFDRIVSCAKGHQYDTHLKDHAKYGPVVRIGPCHVSFSDAEALSTVYGMTTKFNNSSYHRAFNVKTPLGNLPTVFSIRDETGHRALKRPVANAYWIGTMVELETPTDVCIQILERKLDVIQGQDIDFATGLHWYAFDVITSITFSNRLGFMEQEKDVGSIVEAIEGRLMYNSVVGQVPHLHDFCWEIQWANVLPTTFPLLQDST